MPNVAVGSVTLHVQRLGTVGAPTVVLLHGLVMDNLSSLYFTLAGPLSQRFDVVLFDLRGHGLSTRPATGYDIATLVADLVGLLDALDLKAPVHLVGHSFGGVLALALAASAPSRVASVVLLDGHVGSPGWGERMAKTLQLSGEARDQTIAERFAHWLGRGSPRKTKRLVETATALVEGTTLVADLSRSPAVDVGVLVRENTPILAIYGERSDLRDEAWALTQAVPSVRLSLVEGATHSVLWERTAHVCQTVVDWMTSTVEPSSAVDAERASG